MSRSPHRAAAGPSLMVLVLLSGFCGISYEILYARWLGNLLGNQFVITASVLVTFLLGIGLGTLFAHRLARWLWAIEAGIGAYAILLALSYGAIDRLLYSQLAMLGTSTVACALVSMVLLAVPAFLIGCSLPIFAALLKTSRVAEVFSVAYGIYNVGAAATALAMEFVLLRSVGLAAAAWILAALNGGVALGVARLTVGQGVTPFVSATHLRFPGRAVSALVTASLASAVFQLLMIKVAEFVFGPYNETFALVLAVVLIGLALGSYLVARCGLTFGGAVRLALAGVVWVLAMTPLAITAYAGFHGRYAESYALLVGLKFATVLGLMAPAAAGFGATIPALLGRHEDVARESGQLLFYSSVANAAGFFLMAFVLHRYLDYWAILCVVAVLALAAGLVFGTSTWKGHAASGSLAGLGLIAALGIWDEPLLYVGHTNFHSSWELEEERGTRAYAERFKGPQDVFAIVWKDETPYFFINGYISIPLNSTAEKLVGALSTALAPRTDRALVLGVGSGNTAGTVGLLFDRVDAVEINKVVLDHLDLMSEYNFDLAEMPNVRLIHDDGIHFIKTTQERYSLILNTVTTPLYFSSSKLYTQDFFELVARRLSPNGVYVTWVDSRIGDAGVDIVLETLAQTFDECWLSFMNSEYYLLTCATDELAPGGMRSVIASTVLDDHLADEHELLARWVPYHVLSTRALELRSTSAPVNRLNYPVLEFEMAQLADSGLGAFTQRLAEALAFRELGHRLEPMIDWRPGEFALYKDLRLPRDTPLTGLLQEAVAAQIPAETDYRGAALAAATELGTGTAFYKYGRRLLGRDDPEGAHAAFEHALALGVEAPDIRYYLGRALFAAGRWQDAIAMFEEQWRANAEPRVPLITARALIELHRLDEAAAWLRRGGAPEEASEIAYTQGLVKERSGALAGALMAYRAALAQDPGNALALDALRRVGGPGID